MGIKAEVNGGKEWPFYLRQLVKNSQWTLKVGLLSGATYPLTGLSVAQVAYWNEYGTLPSGTHPGIPARPFFRQTILRESSNWGAGFAKDIHGHVGEKDAFRRALQRLGFVMVADIQDTINDADLFFDGSAESTIDKKRRRGKADPDTVLIDYGIMQEAIESNVIPRGSDNA